MASFPGETMMSPHYRLGGCLLLLSLTLLGGCAARGDATRPIPSALVHAPQRAQRVVVMLPGRGDDLAGLQQQGVAQIIQRAWPDADVILTGLTMPYYTAGVATRRLHDEVIAPLKAHGYRQVWLAGISLGGMGTLLYDRAYPGQLDGMLLLSPYLGDRAIQQEIRDAGGLAAWQPGPVQPLGPDTFQRELWRYLKHWSADPARTQTTWLAYGADERFRAAIELMSPQLPRTHVLMLPGQHNWKLWKPAMRRVLQLAAPAAGH
jgi:pimeloyl-ACP methyl ester carboxylesterase